MTVSCSGSVARNVATELVLFSSKRTVVSLVVEVTTGSSSSSLTLTVTCCVSKRPEGSVAVTTTLYCWRDS